MSKYVLGIDGGSTKTVCLLADLHGVAYGRGESGISNPNYVNQEELRETLRRATEGSIASLNSSLFEIIGVCLGIAGAGSEEKQNLIRGVMWDIVTDLVARYPSLGLCDGFEEHTHIQVHGDTVVALVSGAGLRYGMVVISGTGSIVYGETSDGLTAFAGGWGHLLANEGSGYQIGTHALKAIVRASDGRDVFTLLEPIILEYWNCTSTKQLFLYMLSGDPTIADIADLSKMVDKAAKLDDHVAKDILKRAGRELAIGVKAVATRLGFLNQEFPLVLTGGVLLNIELVGAELISRIRCELPMAQIIEPLVEPVQGAVILALERRALT
ncbi:hypothetical protein EKD04_005945 [Chloroflexales bacterium ZM16-3]|nr:hypothetical protein [Chloroflexales bacterium ZM16-3]